MKNASKNRALKWILASVLLCALLACAWAVAAGAEESPHEHDYMLYVDWSEDTTKEPTVTNARLVCQSVLCGDTVTISNEEVKVEDNGFASDATCTHGNMYYYLASAVYDGKLYESESANAYPRIDSKPLGHDYDINYDDFTISENKETATGTVVCWRCDENTEGHTITVTATVTDYEEYPGSCIERSYESCYLSYELNGETVGRYLYIEGDYGTHSFTTKPSAQLVHTATCTKAAEYNAQCDFCDAVSETKTVEVGDPLGHSYKLTTDFTPAANGETATATAVCERCQDSITVTAERGRMVGQDLGTCEEHAWQELEYIYTLNGEWYVISGLRLEGDYGDHDFTVLVTLDGKQISECSICGELEGVEEQPSISGELTGNHPVQADHIEVRYGTLENGKKALVITLVDRYGDAVATSETCEVSISLAELNALMGEDANAAFDHKLYWNDPWTRGLDLVQSAAENGKLILNVTFKNSSVCVLTID